MPMPNNGLTKLTEEAAELISAAARLSTWPNEKRPGDDADLKEELINEMGDVLAAIGFVSTKLNIDLNKVLARRNAKLGLYHRWDREI